MLRGAHLAYDASREGRPPGGMNSVRRDRVAPRLVRLGAGLVVGGTLVAAPEAPAYRLMHDREGAILGGESGAFRWPDDAWPLRYRLLENDLLPVDVFADHDAWREFLGAAFQQWNDIPTAEVDIRLEGEPVMQRDGSDGDGINTIGFSADLEATGGRINGRVSWVLTDEDGRFLIEGLRPGPVMLWFHPSVIPGAHQFVGEFAFWFQDQWLFAEVTAGETTEVPAIALRRGRATIE